MICQKLIINFKLLLQRHSKSLNSLLDLIGRCSCKGSSEKHIFFLRRALGDEPAASAEKDALVDGSFEDGLFDLVVGFSFVVGWVFAPVYFYPVLEGKEKEGWIVS